MEEIESEIQQLTTKLNKFINNNSYLNIENTNGKYYIVNPWEDDTVQIEVSIDNEILLESLNSVILPPPLSAIFHTDTYTFEFIFTVASPDNYLWSRAFDFIFNGVTYPCYYGESSEKLLSIASATRPRKPSSNTKHRNLRIYNDYCCQEKLPEPMVKFFENKKPISFFLGPFTPKNNDEIIELSRHLNFYMFYFDRNTPIIEIYRPDEDFLLNEQEVTCAFPDKLIGSTINPYLLDLWTSASSLHGRLSFLYYYQILEYAGFYYIDEDVKLRIEKILRKPDLLSTTSTCISQAIDEIIDYRLTDEQKLNAVIKRSSDPEKIWGVLEPYKDYFCNAVYFDGGFSVEPLIKQEWSHDDFAKSWYPKVPEKLRLIRNALVHSRESRVGQVIAPTRANNKRLIPWIKIIEEIACQVAIYRNV